MQKLSTMSCERENQNKIKARKISTNIRSRNCYFFLKAELVVAGVCTLALFKKKGYKIKP